MTPESMRAYRAIWANTIKEAIKLLFLALTENNNGSEGRRFVNQVKEKLHREADPSFDKLKHLYEELRSEDKRQS